LPDKTADLDVVEVFSDAPSPTPGGEGEDLVKVEVDEDEDEDEDELRLKARPAVSEAETAGSLDGADGEGSRRRLRQRAEVNYHVKAVRVKRQPDTIAKKRREEVVDETEVVIPVWRPIKTKHDRP
jgi:hypothetical protein